MKITQKRIRQIIKEEVANHLEETGEIYTFDEEYLREVDVADQNQDNEISKKEFNDLVDSELKDLNRSESHFSTELEDKTDEDQLHNPRTKKVIKIHAKMI